MDKEILYAERLTTDHPSEQNIDHISFSLRQGEILAVTGLRAIRAGRRSLWPTADLRRRSLHRRSAGQADLLQAGQSVRNLSDYPGILHCI